MSKLITLIMNEPKTKFYLHLTLEVVKEIQVFDFYYLHNKFVKFNEPQTVFHLVDDEKNKVFKFNAYY